MAVETKLETSVKQAVPFFAVSDMETSLRFYVDELGCRMKHRWVDEGKLRWCWLEIGNAAVMLQEFRKEGHDSWVPESKVGVGVTIYFTCKDALELYREFRGRGIDAQRPFVGNRQWSSAWPTRWLQTVLRKSHRRAGRFCVFRSGSVSDDRCPVPQEKCSITHSKTWNPPTWTRV
ncbi:MAG TPA: VOC family protein [Candidatus Angelobacter sp.]|nr:VOC family protein [Candidatus Angelobacter sp.]